MMDVRMYKTKAVHLYDTLPLHRTLTFFKSSPEIMLTDFKEREERREKERERNADQLPLICAQMGD